MGVVGRISAPEALSTDSTGEAAQNWLSRVVETAPEAIVTVDARGEVVQLNPAAERLFGSSRRELFGERFVDLLVPPEHSSSFWPSLIRAIESEGPAVLGPSAKIRAKRQTGEEIPVELAIVKTSELPLLLTVFIRAPLVVDDESDEDDLYAEAAFVHLSERELDVLLLAADGLSGPQIAERLVVTPATVKSHFENIYEKLGVTSRGGAVAKGIRLRLIR